MMRTVSKAHSYEELRAVVIDILLGEQISHPDGNYTHLVEGVAEVLLRRGAAFQDNPMTGNSGIRLQTSDIELVRDIF